MLRARLAAVSPSTTRHPFPAVETQPLVLSLKPRFAEAILDGSKTVELRRTRLLAPPGTCLVLYASSPVMAVVGTATLAAIDTASPTAIWRRHNSRVGLGRAEYDTYFRRQRLRDRADDHRAAAPRQSPRTGVPARRNRVSPAAELPLPVATRSRGPPPRRPLGQVTMTRRSHCLGAALPCPCLTWRSSKIFVSIAAVTTAGSTSGSVNSFG